MQKLRSSFSHGPKTPGKSSKGVELRQIDVDLFTACRTANSADTVLQLLNDGANVNARGPEGETPLHVATFHDNYKAVDALIVNGAPLNLPEKIRGTPLHVAAHRNAIRACRVLLSYNANHWIKRPGGGETALDLAKKGTPLHNLLASWTGGSDGETLLHVAAYTNDLETAEFALSRLKVYPMPLDRFGITPLHLANLHGHTEMAHLLCHYGASPLVPSYHGVPASAVDGESLECRETVERVAEEQRGAIREGKDAYPLYFWDGGKEMMGEAKAKELLNEYEYGIHSSTIKQDKKKCVLAPLESAGLAAAVRTRGQWQLPWVQCKCRLGVSGRWKERWIRITEGGQLTVAKGTPQTDAVPRLATTTVNVGGGSAEEVGLSGDCVGYGVVVKPFASAEDSRRRHWCTMWRFLAFADVETRDVVAWALRAAISHAYRKELVRIEATSDPATYLPETLSVLPKARSKGSNVAYGLFPGRYKLWQSATRIVLVLDVPASTVMADVSVRLHETRATVRIAGQKKSLAVGTLFAPIIVSECRFFVAHATITLQLHKKEPGVWPSLFQTGDDAALAVQAAVKASTTATKKPREEKKKNGPKAKKSKKKTKETSKAKKKEEKRASQLISLSDSGSSLSSSSSSTTSSSSSSEDDSFDGDVDDDVLFTDSAYQAATSTKGRTLILSAPVPTASKNPERKRRGKRSTWGSAPPQVVDQDASAALPGQSAIMEEGGDDDPFEAFVTARTSQSANNTPNPKSNRAKRMSAPVVPTAATRATFNPFESIAEADQQAKTKVWSPFE